MVCTMAVLLLALYLVSGRSMDTRSYSAVYSDVAGVGVGTAVTYGGYVIGQVAEVSPLRVSGKTAFKLDLIVNSDWQIPKDSVASIFSPGLLSEKTINIVEGVDSEVLQPGEMLATRKSSGLFDAMDDVALEIKDLSENGIRPMLQNFSYSVERISRRLDSVGSELDGGVPRLVKKTDMLLSTLNKTADTLARTLSETNQKHFSNILTNADRASAQLRELSVSLGVSAQKLDLLLDKSAGTVSENQEDLRKSVQNLKKIVTSIAKTVDSVVYNLDTSSRNINEFSRQIRQNPGLLLGGSSPSDQAEAHR
ncbi:MAG: MlaD family protein [Gammaproteobacteria bacterium]|nr:MlaD family protein [Gammaproteobacteria bacterium]MDH5799344.1 MlaD family protein [Gammaproteobacteria bacterium]